MRTIAFVSKNDGAGKSTLAGSLAVAAHEAKEAVALVDMDPQGSLTNWARTRGFGDIGVVASGAARLPAALKALAAKGCTLAIIDTPGAEGPAPSAAMAAADLSVILSRPSLFDLRASADTRAALLEIGGDFVFLLNQRPPGRRSARVRDGVERLREMGAVIAPLISSRAEHQEAARRGRGVTEIDPTGGAAAKMRRLWSSIRRRLDRTPAKSAGRAAA
jgi:chromosome partitioning protein